MALVAAALALKSRRHVPDPCPPPAPRQALRPRASAPALSRCGSASAPALSRCGACGGPCCRHFLVVGGLCLGIALFLTVLDGRGSFSKLVLIGLEPARAQARLDPLIACLRATLDPAVFWQVHRGTLVQARAIPTARREKSGKLTLTLRGRPEKLVASRLCAHLFKGM